MNEKTFDPIIFTMGLVAGKRAGGGTGGGSADVRYVTFMSYDGSVEYGKKAVAVGDDCADPIARGIFDTPTRESSAQYDYSFVGWATTPNGAWDKSALDAVTEDRTVYAAYAAAVRYYTVTYLDSDGVTVLKTESLAYGSTPVGYTPEKEGYSFAGWTPNFATVTGNASYTATWIEAVTFAGASWSKIAEIAEAGNAADYFEVGNTRDIVCNGNTYTILIVGFAHDDLADGSGKAGISCLLQGTYGSTATYGGGNWRDCSLRTLCNNTIYNGLEDELKAVIKQVTKGSFVYNGSGGKVSTSDYVWALSAAEAGYSLWGGTGSKYTDAFGSGNTVSGAALSVDYWLRDARTTGSYAYYVKPDNAQPQTASQANEKAVRFGFCI